mmetsp:Transcript_106233/g.317401  ORF Transcript_106233/g.317401 Transcript_106233/m.317401 type:complete len:286 (+) Transcript_106233:381-1238(+)
MPRSRPGSCRRSSRRCRPGVPSWRGSSARRGPRQPSWRRRWRRVLVPTTALMRRQRRSSAMRRRPREAISTRRWRRRAPQSSQALPPPCRPGGPCAQAASQRRRRRAAAAAPRRPPRPAASSAASALPRGTTTPASRCSRSPSRLGAVAIARSQRWTSTRTRGPSRRPWPRCSHCSRRVTPRLPREELWCLARALRGSRWRSAWTCWTWRQRCATRSPCCWRLLPPSPRWSVHRPRHRHLHPRAAQRRRRASAHGACHEPRWPPPAGPRVLCQRPDDCPSSQKRS